MRTLSLKKINEITTRINSAEELAALLPTIMDTARDLLETEGASLLLYDAETDELIFDVARGKGGSLLAKKRIPPGQGIAGECAKTRQPIVVADAPNDPRLFRSIGEEINFVTRNLIAVPMQAGEELIGVLEVVNSADNREFNGHDIRVLEYLAGMAAIAIRNRKLIEDLKDRADELQCVYEIAQVMMRQDRFEEGLDSILSSIEDVLGVERVSLIVKDDDGTEARIVKVRGFTLDDHDVRIDPYEGIAGVVMRSGDPLLVRDIEREMNLLPVRAGGYKTKSFVSVPVRRGDDVIGTLNAADKKDGTPFDVFELKVLATIAGQIGDLHRRSLDRQHELELANYRKDLETAAQIQANSLPKIPSRVAGLDIATRYEASKDVGGDFYDLIYHSDDRISFVMADVAGKGVPAALFMEYAKTLLAGQVMRNLDPVTTLAAVNQEIFAKSQMVIFVTVMLVQLEREHYRLRLASAGHNHQILYRAGQGVEMLSAKGPPVGIYGDVEYFDNIFEYAPGDLLILYTDGITEANNTTYDEFSEERLFELVEKHHAEAPQDLIDIVFADVNKFRDGMEPSDDATMMVVRL